MERRQLKTASLLGLFAFGALVAGAIGGCSKPDENSGNPSAQSGGAEPAKSSFSVKGSDTMVQLAQAWAQEFMKVHPEISVTVTGGGSNTGIAALINNSTEIADASRPMKDEEKNQAEGKGVDPQEFVVARDALTIIVNRENSISDLTMAQLKDIYTGKVKNWKEVGGADMKIVLYSRESSSGSYTFFLEHVLKKEPYAAEAMNQPSTSQIVEGVGQDKGSIGYVGLGYVTEKVKSVPIKKDAAAPAVAASLGNVLNDSYPLARPLFEYTNGKPSGAIQIWLNWIQGTDAQKIVKDQGFVPAK